MRVGGRQDQRRRLVTAKALGRLAVFEARKRPTRVVVILGTVGLGAAVLGAALSLGASVNRAVHDGLDVEYRNVDVVIHTDANPGTDSASGVGAGSSTGIQLRQVKQIAALPGVSTVGTYVRAVAVAQVGKTTLGLNVESLNTAKLFRWQGVSRGTFPTRPNEVALTPVALSQLRVGLGDAVALQGTSGSRELYRVVGVVDVKGSIYRQGDPYGVVPTKDAEDLAGMSGPNSLELQSHAGTDVQQLIARINRKAPIGLPQAAADILSAKREIHGALIKSISVVAVGLAGVSCVVAALASATITGASLTTRRRAWALVRCVGGGRRHIAGLVLAESAALGLFGGIVGCGLGVGLAWAAIPATSFIPGFPALTTNALVVPPNAILLPVVLAVGLALVSAFVPAWRAARIAPSAALVASRTEVSRAPRIRALVGLVALASGGGLALASSGLMGPTQLAGSLVLIVLGSGLMTRPLHVGVAGLAARCTRTVESRLGLLDIVRRPRAAVIEAVAVMTAVTMISLSWTAISSVEAATSARLSDSSLPDLTVGAIAASSPISGATSGEIRKIQGLRSVVGVPFGRSVVVRGSGKAGPASIAIGTAGGDTTSLRSVLPKPLGVSSLRDDTVYLPTSEFPPFTPKSTVLVSGPNGKLRGMHVRYLPGLPVPSMLTPNALAKVSKKTDVRMLLLALSPGVDRAAVIGRVQGVALLNNQLPVSGPAVLDVSAAGAFSSARGAAAAILAFAVLVAILGAAATGALSIKEQGREHATLRALGLPRRKLGNLLTTRILAISLVAAGQGVLTGAAIGLIVARQVVATLGLSATLGIPVLPIILLVLITIAAIRIAALVPMERASYVPPSRALAQS